MVMNTEPIRMVHGGVTHLALDVHNCCAFVYTSLISFVHFVAVSHIYSCTFEHIQRLSDQFPPKNLFRKLEFNRRHISLAWK